MKTWLAVACLVLCIVALRSRAGAQSILINEILAKNATGIRDVDGHRSSWVEFFNTSDTVVSLDGWAVTDDSTVPFKWVFSDVEVPARGFLVVFCSGKDLRNPAGELHTNFRLSSAGEYVGLFRSDGALEDQIAPFYPQQFPDVPYGRRQSVEETVLVAPGETLRYHVPADDSLGVSWTEIDFDDAGWHLGPGGIGFDQKAEPTLANLIGTDIREMMLGVNASMYARVSFDVADVDSMDLLRVRIDFEDGYVAYLNGVEVASDNAPGVRLFDSRATLSRTTTSLREGNVFALEDHRNHLRVGRNVLALHGLNFTVASNDFVIYPVVDSLRFVETGSRVLEFFESPTPGLPNGDGSPAVARLPTADPASGILIAPIELSLTSPDGGEIRVTRDGDVPDATSELYTGPLAIDSTTRIRTRAFVPGLIASTTEDFYFPMLDFSVVDFNSDLPIFLVETFGTTIPAEPKVSGFVQVIDVDAETGRSRLVSEPRYSGPMGIEGRGSSTADRVKKSYSLEIRDHNGDDFDVPLLGMPAESDWVLYGPLNHDRAMMRNPLMYELSNQLGLYAVRTRYVEVFVNLDASAIDRRTDYYGVYVFMEKIKRGPGRVDVERLLPAVREEPEISGGYILKIDRPGPGDTGFAAARQAMQHVYPREEDIPLHQKQWLVRHFDAFGTALFGVDFADPVVGYEKYIDVDNWIDFHILNEFSKNPDGFVLSTFFHKSRNERIRFGPIWDFDRAMGADDDDRAVDPVGWIDQHLYNWWGRLFSDPDFVNRYMSRWEELRAGPLSLDNLYAIIDSMSVEIAEAQERNFQRWTGLVSETAGWESEVRHLKDWIEKRVNWMDTQLLFLPLTIEPESGLVELPIAVRITNPSMRGEVYYTLNGPDPRQSNLDADPLAILHDGQPIVIDETTRLRTRIHLGETVWGDLVEALYFGDLPTIAISEIMYNPAGGSEFEYIELYNYGDAPVQLHESSLTRGVLLDIRDGLKFLAPGDYTVVVNDLEKFVARYDIAGMNISGEYSGILSDSGEFVSFRGSLGQQIVEFQYVDVWFPETDGRGHSLVLVDLATPPDQYGEFSSWRASLESGGSPGTEDVQELPEGGQISGDSNQDGRFNISDALHLVTLVFEVAEAFPCKDGRVDDISNLVVFDTNGDSRVDASDVVYNLLYLFVEGQPPVQGTECFGVRDCPVVCGSEG